MMATMELVAARRIAWAMVAAMALAAGLGVAGAQPEGREASPNGPDAAPAPVSPEAQAAPERAPAAEEEQATPAPLGPPRPPYRFDAALLRTGRAVFADRCADCHGARGRGDGPDARYLSPAPRDLTRGVYALRSTQSGTLPTAEDILRTLRRGIPGTSMPAWSGLPERTLWALVAYVESLSPRFAREPRGEAILVPAATPATAESISRGRRIYVRMGCAECHGRTGRGDGPAARTLTDDLGRPALPFDFTRGWKMKAGSSPEDVYRTFHTGIDGTPMPSYHDVIDERDSWDLVHYTRSLFVQ
jgi:mono/diheme cytochrome c family protein